MAEAASPEPGSIVTRPEAAKFLLVVLDELEDDPRVEHGKIGQATTYWLAPDVDAPSPPPDDSDSGSADQQGGEQDHNEELLTGGGVPAEGRNGDLVEMMNELRETHVQSQEQMQRKIEEMESKLAGAIQEGSEDNRADEVDQKIRAFEQESRIRSASGRSVVGFLIGFITSIYANVFGGGEFVNLLAGVIFLYAIFYALYYVYLLFTSDHSDSSADVGGAPDGN